MIAPLDAGLAYASRGLRVLPVHTVLDGRCSCRRGDCRSPGKHPMIRAWQKHATTEVTTIRRWRKRWPHANVGIATGAESGVIVLDVDPKSGGDVALLDVVEAEGGISFLYHCVTGSFGDHYYLTHPGGEVSNGTGVLGPGLDIKGDDGFVVAPPSLHASGERYQWAETWLTGDPMELAHAAA